MRIILLSAFPHLDRHTYKQRLFEGLSARSYFSPSETILVYGHTRLRDYREEALKFGWLDSLRKARNLLHTSPSGNTPAAATSTRTLSARARDLGIEVREYGCFADSKCRDFAHRFNADVIVNLSGQYVPREFLGLSRVGVVGAHYALLPAIRGGDTVRWSILLDVPVYVCHMILAPEMDMGDIVRKAAVAVTRGDRVEDIRQKCRVVSAQGFLDVLDRIHDGRLERSPQTKADGKTFFRMGRHMKHKVDAVLLQQHYAHYV